MVIDIGDKDSGSDLFEPGVSKGPKPWSKVKHSGGIGMPGVIDPATENIGEAAGQVFGDGIVQLACRRQYRNTCGVRAAANARAAVLGGATHNQIFQAAHATLDMGNPRDVATVLDIYDDEVDAVANVGRDAGNYIPVVNNFLQYDAMVNGDFPPDAGSARVIGYRNQIGQWEAMNAGQPAGTPGPELRAVFMTQAGAGLSKPGSVGHYFSVSLVYLRGGGFRITYVDSLGPQDRRDLINEFIGRYLI